MATKGSSKLVCGGAAMVAGVFFMTIVAAAESAKSLSVASPEKSIEVQVKLEPLTYSISMLGKSVLGQSALGLELKDQAPMGGWTLLHEELHTTDRTWTPAWGKVSQIHDNYTELDLSLEEKAGGRMPSRSDDSRVSGWGGAPLCNS